MSVKLKAGWDGTHHLASPPESQEDRQLCTSSMLSMDSRSEDVQAMPAQCSMVKTNPRTQYSLACGDWMLTSIWLDAHSGHTWASFLALNYGAQALKCNEQPRPSNCSG